MESIDPKTIGAVLGAILIGVICGLMPLITGLVKKQSSLGFIGLIGSIVGGFILGVLLALPIAIVFTIIIVSKKQVVESLPPNPPDFNS